MVQHIGLLLKFLLLTLPKTCAVQTLELEFQILAVGVIGLELGLEAGQTVPEFRTFVKTLYVEFFGLAVGGYGIHDIKLEGLCAQCQVLML